jgi:hypothetical protein
VEKDGRRKRKVNQNIFKILFMQTGENEQALRKIIDMTRLISIIVLALHFYYSCYQAFAQWNLTARLSDRVISNIYQTGLFSSFNKSKLIAAGLLFISLVGAKGRKKGEISYKQSIVYIISGLLIYFFSYLILTVKIKITGVTILYIAITSIGYLLVLSGGTLLSRIIKSKFNNKDIFNKENGDFSAGRKAAAKRLLH